MASPARDALKITIARARWKSTMQAPFRLAVAGISGCPERSPRALVSQTLTCARRAVLRSVLYCSVGGSRDGSENPRLVSSALGDVVRVAAAGPHPSPRRPACRRALALPRAALFSAHRPRH